MILFTSKSYSVTTAKHKGIVLRACSHLTIFTVANPLSDPSGNDVKDYKHEVEFMATKAAKARKPAQDLEALERSVAEANLFCETFGFKTRFQMPDNLDELKAKAKASAEREGKARAAKLAKFEAECAETVQQWLDNQAVSIPYQYGKVLLRVKPSSDGPLSMETSKGATVPLDEAEKAFRFAMIQRKRGWHKNGEQFKVGDYHLDAVNEQGVIAGCHRITWEEIERFAKAQNWI